MDFSANGGVYSAKWPDDGVTMNLNRLKDDSRGGITAEIEIMNNKAINPLVLQERYNLLSGRSRAGIANECEERFPDMVAWRTYIDSFSITVVRAHREGEPIVELKDLPAREGVRWRLEPLMFEGQPNLIFGDGGLGKSLFATYLSVLIAGAHVTNRLTPEPGNVLYLDYEASADEVRERHEGIAAGLDTATPSLMYQFNHQPLVDRIQELQRIVADNNITFLVIDSAAAACGGEPELSKNAIPYFQALRSLKITTLTIAHVSKAGGGKRGPFGSVFWVNMPRSVWEVRKAQEMGKNNIDFSLWHTKVNVGRLLPPLAYRIRFEENTNQITFDDIEVKDSDELAKGLPLPHRIKNALEVGAMTSNDLADLLDVSPNTLRMTLSRDKGTRFVLLQGGKWGNAVV